MFKKQNARKGIKTAAIWTQAIAKGHVVEFKKQNARKGIKTQTRIYRRARVRV